MMPALAEKGYHCLAFSFRGHGASPGSRRASIARYADDIEQVVSDLAEPPVLVGHSMGGVCGAALPRPGTSASCGGAGLSGAPARGVAHHLEGGSEPPDGLRPAESHTRCRATGGHTGAGPGIPGGVRRTLRGPRSLPRPFGGSFLSGVSRHASQPTLVEKAGGSLTGGGGSEDAFFTEAQWRDTADAIGADLAILEGVGHQPMWEGGGGPLIEVLADFLELLPAS